MVHSRFELLTSNAKMKRKASGAASNARGVKRRKDRARGDAVADEKLYSLSDTILVLGDGDFTFSRGLVTHRGGGRKLCATSYDSETQVRAKYSNAADCIRSVRSEGAVVLHGVDATKLHELRQRASAGGAGAIVPHFFQYIVFNFPHTGQQRVHLNRALLLEFFESARRKLVKAGEVHITLKNRPPYSNWMVEDQAKAAGFVLKARRKFNHRLFPGYNHRTTEPDAKKFEAELCITYVFIVNRSRYPFDPKDIDAVEEVPAESEVDEESDTNKPLESEGVESGAIQPATQRGRTASKRGKRKKALHIIPDSASSILHPTGFETPPPVKKRKTTLAWQWRPLHRRGGVR